MRGILTFHPNDPIKPKQLVDTTHEYELEFPNANSAENPRVVHCFATFWQIGKQTFLVSKFATSATGVLTLHIMGMVNNKYFTPLRMYKGNETRIAVNPEHAQALRQMGFMSRDEMEDKV